MGQYTFEPQCDKIFLKTRISHSLLYSYLLQNSLSFFDKMEVENNVNFTAFLYRQNWTGTIKMPCTTQRIQIDTEDLASFSDLADRLVTTFQELKSPMVEFTVYWGSAETDWRPIKNDSGLLAALKGMKGPVFQLHITVKTKALPQILTRLLNII